MNLRVLNNGNGNRNRAQRQPDLASYRRVALQLHLDLPRPDSMRSVLLVTPRSSPFCAYGSAAVASSLATELCKPVLLADASGDRAGLSSLLDYSSAPGFGELIRSPNGSLDELALPTSQEFLSFLPVGKEDGEPRQSPEDGANRLLRSAALRYDFTVVSGGSVLENPLGLNIVALVGCVLLLVIEDQTVREDLDAAQQALILSKARKVGLVLTTPMKAQAGLPLSVTPSKVAAAVCTAAGS